MEIANIYQAIAELSIKLEDKKARKQIIKDFYAHWISAKGIKIFICTFVGQTLGEEAMAHFMEAPKSRRSPWLSMQSGSLIRYDNSLSTNNLIIQIYQ